MVVTGSRLEAVRWQLAIDKYIKDKGYPLKTLVAFWSPIGVEENHAVCMVGVHCTPCPKLGVRATHTLESLTSASARSSGSRNERSVVLCKRLHSWRKIDRRCSGKTWIRFSRITAAVCSFWMNSVMPQRPKAVRNCTSMSKA